MNRRPRPDAIALALMLLLGGAAYTAPVPRSSVQPAVPATGFPTAVTRTSGAPDPSPTGAGSTPLSRSARPTSAPSPFGAPVPSGQMDARGIATARREPRATPRSSPTAARVRRSPSPSTVAAPSRRPAARSFAGVATWYCLPGRSACTVGFASSGAFAAAGAPLRRALGSSWRGRLVTVCTPDCIQPRVSVAVRLIDVCVCERVLDLYASAFGQLAGLSTGELDVEVSW